MSDLGVTIAHYAADILPISLWRAFGVTLAISSAPTIILYFIPISALGGPVYGLNPLQILLTFASGGILGDVVIHAIPHLLNPHDHSDHEHEHGDRNTHDEETRDHDDDHEHNIEVHGGHKEHAHTHDEMDPHMRGIFVGLLILLGFTGETTIPP